MKKIFATFGIPEEVVSDNGWQYSNTRNLFDSTHEFKEFAQEWGVPNATSSPEYPQSNGVAKRAVQTAKRILKKAAADHRDPFEGLLKYRNTPFQDIGVSPVQLLMSRRTGTMIPTHRRLLLPQAVGLDQVAKALKLRLNISKRNYDKQSKDLPSLGVGDKVRIRPNREQGWRKAEVLPRSYVLEDDQGRIYRRNRRQIISVSNDQPMHPPLRVPVVPLFHDSPRSPRLPETDQPASTEAEVPTTFTADAHRSPITTRSGRQVKKPQRLTVRGDMLLLTRDPTGFWVPYCLLGPPRRLFLVGMFEFSARGRVRQFSFRFFLENI